MFEKVYFFLLFHIKTSKGNQYFLCKLQDAFSLPHTTVKKSAKFIIKQ